MKIAFVVQRYGLEINGGAELHCRWVAEHMKKHFEAEVLTTKASDYITWKNHYSKDEEVVNGILCLGRIDENKGCHRLFDYFLRYKKEAGSNIKLVLAGSTVMRIPSHPDILYLGFMRDEDKFNALDGAELLVMPSFYESLSMVTLEAWALSKPVLANALCDVLKGQCLRSNGGLFYENYSEFREALGLLLQSPRLRQILGKNGRKYFDANYTWDIIEAKYLAVLDKLEKDKNA